MFIFTDASNSSDPCTEFNPCTDKGTCTNVPNNVDNTVSYSCACNAGYEGNNCQLGKNVAKVLTCIQLLLIH